MLSVGQIFGSLIVGATVLLPGLALGGFHGGTSWSIFGWLCVSLVGGFFGGLLLAPKHRIAGAIGGVIGAPLALLALYFYSKDRNVIYRAEAAIVSLVASLPGFAVFFVLRLLSDLIFPAKKEEPEDDEDLDDDEDDRPRPSKRRRADDDEDDDDDDDDERPRPSKRRRADDDEDDDDDDDDRPRRSKKRRSEDDDEDEPKSRRKRPRDRNGDDDDDEHDKKARSRREDDDERFDPRD